MRDRYRTSEQKALVAALEAAGPQGSGPSTAGPSPLRARAAAEAEAGAPALRAAADSFDFAAVEAASGDGGDGADWGRWYSLTECRLALGDAGGTDCDWPELPPVAACAGVWDDALGLG